MSDHSVLLPKLSTHGESLWLKDRMVTLILFDLCLFKHFSLSQIFVITLYYRLKNHIVEESLRFLRKVISLSLSNRICHLQRKDDDWKMPPRFLTVFVHLQRTLAFVEWWVKRDEICINHSHECSTILKLHCWAQ